MKKIAYLGIVLLSMGLFVLSCGKDDGPDTSGKVPKIASVSPTSGPVGTMVTLDGTDFGDTQADNTVKFNGVAATIKTASTTRLTVEVPDGAMDGPITVKVGNNTATSSTNFTVTTQSGPDAINLNFTELDLYTLDTEQLEITNLDEFEGNPTVEWKVNDDNLLEIDEEGNVTALNSGQASVTATIGQLTQVCSINISPSVFVVGEEYNGDNYVATQWKNGEGMALSVDGLNGYANGVFVHRKDIYVVGHEENQNGYAGIVWKNGTVHYTLTTQLQDVRMQSIFVTESGNVYTVGNVFEEGVSRATVLRNNVQLYVLNDNDATSATANSLFVTSEDDVLVAGSEEVDGKDVARVWFNNDEIIYSMTSENYTYANDVYMSGDDIFIVGSEDTEGGQIANIWKAPGTSFYSSSNDGTASFSSVFMDNDKVYACGHEFNGDKWEAQIYENGTVSNFTDGITSALTYSIFIHDGSSYIAGYQNNDEMNKVATVWKDKKQLYALGDGKTHSEAGSIFVK